MGIFKFLVLSFQATAKLLVKIHCNKLRMADGLMKWLMAKQTAKVKVKIN
jgi:hypothetical protein